MRKPLTDLVGLATEAYSQHQRKKSGQSFTASDKHAVPAAGDPSHEHAENHLSDYSSYDEDEDEWELDDAQDHLEGPDLKRVDAHEMYNDGMSPDELIDAFIARHPGGAPPPYSAGKGRLIAPVIIPEKRPGTKTHGFVRAYAPTLNDCGIDEETFLDFLDNFRHAIRGGGVFMGVNVAIIASHILATIAIGSYNPILAAVTFVLVAGVDGSRRLYTNSRINKYMARMNEEVFKPKGVWAMLMEWKPESHSVDAEIDIETNINHSVAARAGNKEDGTGGGKSKFKTASGRTGEAQMPLAAPLIYPELDKATDEQKQNAFKRASAFMTDFHDRKAQAQFDHYNPDSQLTSNEDQGLAKSWIDPTHDIHKGGPLNTLSGGNLYRLRKARHERHFGPNDTSKVGAITKRLHEGKLGDASGRGRDIRRPVKKLLSENVVYLMIANLPTDDEMREADKVIKEMKKNDVGGLHFYRGLMKDL